VGTTHNCNLVEAQFKDSFKRIAFKSGAALDSTVDLIHGGKHFHRTFLGLASTLRVSIHNLPATIRTLQLVPE